MNKTRRTKKRLGLSRSQKKWLGFMALASAIEILILYLLYYFKIEFPEFSWLQIGLTFVMGFFPAIFSRILPNKWLGQLRGKSAAAGVSISFKEAVLGWLVYYPLLVMVYVIYMYAITGHPPDLIEMV